jgi:hypothetical protein
MRLRSRASTACSSVMEYDRAKIIALRAGVHLRSGGEAMSGRHRSSPLAEGALLRLTFASMSRPAVGRSMAIAIGLCSVLLQACGHSREGGDTTAARLGPGQFHLTGGGQGTPYLAEAGEGAHSCRFEIVIGESRSGSGPLPLAFAKAELIRKAGSDCTQFLRALGPALGAKGVPAASPLPRIDASVAILGTNQSRGPDGGFFSSPPGPWTATKLFLADGEAEVFLNLDPVDGMGEFSQKDEDYAETVMAELAKVLLPVRSRH